MGVMTRLAKHVAHCNDTPKAKKTARKLVLGLLSIISNTLSSITRVYVHRGLLSLLLLHLSDIHNHTNFDAHEQANCSAIDACLGSHLHKFVRRLIHCPLISIYYVHVCQLSVRIQLHAFRILTTPLPQKGGNPKFFF